MTAQTMIQTETTLPDWEVRFFAEIGLSSAEQVANEAARQHESASARYISSLTEKNRDKQIAARVKFSHSLKRFHATQRNLNKAKAEVARTHTISFHQ